MIIMMALVLFWIFALFWIFVFALLIGGVASLNPYNDNNDKDKDV